MAGGMNSEVTERMYTLKTHMCSDTKTYSTRDKNKSHLQQKDFSFLFLVFTLSLIQFIFL